jgi:hypothetical protein
MALFTATASTAFAGVPIKTEVNRNITVPFYFNSGTTPVVSISGAVVLLCKIPHGATILDFKEFHSCGAASCPADFGYALTGGASHNVSVFATALPKAGAGATGPNLVANTGFSLGLPYKKSLSDDATDRFYYFAAKFIPASATASLLVQGYVTYTMDGL